VRAAATLAGVGDAPIVALLTRLRWLVIGCALALTVVLDSRQDPMDVEVFVRAGETMLSGDWRQAFADPAVQVGPGMLAFYGGLAQLCSALQLPLNLTLSAVLQAASLWFVLHLLRRVRRVRRVTAGGTGASSDAGRELLAGVLLLLLGVPSVAHMSGHPSELAIALLWAHAGLDLREGKVWRPVLLIVCAATLVTHGALGIALLAGLPGPWRRVLLPGAATVAAAALVYLPFTLFGVVHTQQLVWPVVSSSSLAPFLGVGYPFGWSERILQACAAGAVGLLLARAFRGSDVAFWVVPCGIIALRVASDPIVSSYYWYGVQALVVAAVCAADRASVQRWWAAYLAGYPLALSNAPWPPIVAGGSHLLALASRQYCTPGTRAWLRDA
jgi:hypothetical protein